jgi:biotin carboxyl carrier protein
MDVKPGNKNLIRNYSFPKTQGMDVKPGDKLVTDAPFYTVESMKMETKITVPAELNGCVVDEIVAKFNTALKIKQPVISFKREFSTWSGSGRIKEKIEITLN